jgi:WD40-like Beta Propeller Repeat
VGSLVVGRADVRDADGFLALQGWKHVRTGVGDPGWPSAATSGAGSHAARQAGPASPLEGRIRAIRQLKEVAAALDAIAPAPQTLRPRVAARTALLVASILALAIVSYGVWRSRQPERVEVSGQRLLSTMERSHRAPAYSPDGRRLAFLAPDTEGITQIWVRDLSEDAALQVTSGPVAAGRPRWSAATDRIVFARGNQGIWSVSPLGGAPTRITDRGFNPNLSRDGRRLVFESDYRPRRTVRMFV